MDGADLRYIREHQSDAEPARENGGEGVMLLHLGVSEVCVESRAMRTKGHSFGLDGRIAARWWPSRVWLLHHSTNCFRRTRFDVRKRTELC